MDRKFLLFLSVFLYHQAIAGTPLLKISGSYDAVYNMEKDRRDSGWHLSNFPPLMKLYPWSGDPALSSWVDVRPPSDVEPSHFINFVFSAKGENLSSAISFSADSSNDIIAYNETRPIYLNNAFLKYRKNFFGTFFFVKESPRQFDDPMGLFQPGGPARFLFEESPMRTYEWPLGWDGRDCQGVELDFDREQLSARILGIDRYSKYYVNYDGTKQFADSYYIASRFKRNYGARKIGFTYIMDSWRSSRATDTHEESLWIASLDGDFPLASGMVFKPQIAQTVGRYVSRSDLVFDEGGAWILKMVASGKNANFEFSVRNIGRKFSPVLARFYSDERGFNMKTDFSVPAGNFRIYYDYKTNQDGDYPIRDIRFEFSPYQKNDSFLTIKLQNLNYYYTGSTYDEREVMGVKPEARFPVGDKFKMESHLFLIKMTKPIWQKPEISKEYFLKGIFTPLARISFFADAKFIDNLFTRNLDEHLYFLGKIDKLKEFYPKETAPFYMDPSPTDDWVYKADELKHLLWGFGFAWTITNNSSFSVRFERREPGIDVSSGLVNNTQDIFTAKFSTKF